MIHNYNGICYRLFGQPSKPAILFLHGFMGDSTDWKEVADRVSADFYCIAPDLPGHGESKDTQRFNDLPDFSRLSNTLDELISHLHIPAIHVAGYSLGGRLAQHFALEFPGKINKLVLESSSFGIKDLTERSQRRQADDNLAKELQKDFSIDFLNQWYRQPLFYKITAHPNYSDLLRKRIKNDPQWLSKALRVYSVGRQLYLDEKISAFKNRLLLVWGEKDSKYQQIMHSVYQKNPEINYLVMNSCGHNTHFEKPNLFAEHLVEFLSL